MSDEEYMSRVELGIIVIDNGTQLIGLIGHHGMLCVDLSCPAILTSIPFGIQDYPFPCDGIHIHGQCQIITEDDLPNGFLVELVQMYRDYVLTRKDRFSEVLEIVTCLDSSMKRLNQKAKQRKERHDVQ